MGALKQESFDSHRYAANAASTRSVLQDVAEIRTLTERVEHGPNPEAHIEELTMRIKSLAHVIRHHLI